MSSDAPFDRGSIVHALHHSSPEDRLTLMRAILNRHGKERTKPVLEELSDWGFRKLARQLRSYVPSTFTAQQATLIARVQDTFAELYPDTEPADHKLVRELRKQHQQSELQEVLNLLNQSPSPHARRIAKHLLATSGPGRVPDGHLVVAARATWKSIPEGKRRMYARVLSMTRPDLHRITSKDHFRLRGKQKIAALAVSPQA